MPLYEFFCSKCDESVTTLFQLSELKELEAQGKQPEIECPTCKEPMHRMLTAANFSMPAGNGFGGSKPRKIVK